MKQYLIQKQFVQHLARTVQQVDDVLVAQKKEDKATIQTLTNVLGRSLETQRAYDLDKHPHASIFLFIETVLNFKLRKDQVENIEKLITGMEKGESIALQMIMGAGKTSLIQPVLAFLLADPKTLSCVDVPEAQLKAVQEGLSAALGNAFRQYVYSMPYDRELAKDENYLKTFYDSLEEAQKRGGQR